MLNIFHRLRLYIIYLFVSYANFRKMASINTEQRKGSFKVDYLKEIELRVQASWQEKHVFEEDAPTFTSGNKKDDKFM